MKYTLTEEDRNKGRKNRKKSRVEENGQVMLVESMTRRQLQIFLLLCQKPIKEVAAELDLRSNVIARHHVPLFGKLIGTTHRGTWMKLAVEQGLIPVALPPIVALCNSHELELWRKYDDACQGKIPLCDLFTIRSQAREERSKNTQPSSTQASGSSGI